MLHSAIDAKVDAFVVMHENLRDECRRRQTVKNGSLPEREIQPGAEAISVTQGVVRDDHPNRINLRDDSASSS